MKPHTKRIVTALLTAAILAAPGAGAEPAGRPTGPTVTTQPSRPDAIVPEAARPMTIAVLAIAPDPGAGDPNLAASAGNWHDTMDRNMQSLPSAVAGRAVRYEVLDLDDSRALARLDDYPAALLLPEWTLMLPALDDHAKAIAAFVKRGGGLVVFQPNPLVVYPAGAKPPPALAKRGIKTEYCTPALLGLPATFYNRYERCEGVRNVAGESHAITEGLSDEQMPYPADQIVSLDDRYAVLARGASSGSPSLAAAAWGDGRIVLIADNVGGSKSARRQPPATVVARSLLWAAGADDKIVRTVTAKAAEVPSVAFSTEPANEDGEGPYQPAEVEIVRQAAPNGVSGVVAAAQEAPADDHRPSVLAKALAEAAPGDVIRLQAGVYDAGSLTVPAGVTLVGAGPANTVVKVSCPKPMGAAVELDGNCAVKDVTLLSEGRRRGYMIRAAGGAATPTVHRCVLLPHANEFCALAAWNGAAPTISHCVVVSPVGEYGVFARDKATPVIDHCTIVSRGFGVGMMDSSTPIIRRCILAGRSPGLLIQTNCEPAVKECVIFCREGSGTYRYPVTRWKTVTTKPDGGGGKAGIRIVADPAADILQRDDVLTINPKLRPTATLRGWLAPANPAAARYGAYAGAAWPAAVPDAPKVKLPDVGTSSR